MAHENTGLSSIDWHSMMGPMKNHGWALSCLVASALATACSSSTKPPSVASSGGQTAYALHYGEELTASTKAVADLQAKEKTLSAGFGAYVDQLKKPEWERVETIIDDSDEAGKSADFADASEQASAVKSFWDSEKNDIGARVNGTTQQKLKESGCSGDTGGVIAYAMGEALNKQLQKKLRSRNEAFVVLERYKTALGPQNVTTLEKLADDVSEASYDVHVAMVLERARLERLVGDKNDVKKSIDRFIQEETDFQAEPGRSDAEKKASADRVTAANKNKAELDNVASQAENVSKEMEKSTDAATKEYEEALKNLKARVSEKKKSEPKEPPKPKA
jgi:hypothetical protein